MARKKGPPKFPLTDGAAALRGYLDNVLHQSVPDFCEAHALDRIAVQRALNGDRKRISVDFAAAVERATEGAVPWHLWSRHPDVSGHLHPQPSGAG